jgi:hypothetical protein
MKRIWIYQADRNFTEQEAADIQSELNQFSSEWNAHGQPLEAQAKVMHNRFIVMAVDESAFEASGCSIDSSVRFLRTLGQKYHLNLFDRTRMAYLSGEDVETCALNEIGELYKQGLIGDDTLVFDNSILYAGDLESTWKKPFAQSGFSRFK